MFSPCSPFFVSVSVQLSVLMSVPCQHRAGHHDDRRPGQHAVRVGKSVLVPPSTRPQAVCPLPCKNGIVRRAGKSIIQMLLPRQQMTAGGLHFSSYMIPTKVR